MEFNNLYRTISRFPEFLHHTFDGGRERCWLYSWCEYFMIAACVLSWVCALETIVCSHLLCSRYIITVQIWVITTSLQLRRTVRLNTASQLTTQVISKVFGLFPVKERSRKGLLDTTLYTTAMFGQCQKPPDIHAQEQCCVRRWNYILCKYLWFHSSY